MRPRKEAELYYYVPEYFIGLSGFYFLLEEPYDPVIGKNVMNKYCCSENPGEYSIPANI